MEENNPQIVLESLTRLRTNKDYLLVVKELKAIDKTINNLVYDENTSDSDRKMCVIKKNLIKNFLELPEDMFNAFKLSEGQEK